MKYVSTRDSMHVVSLKEAITANLDKAGGLFVPESFPQVRLDLFKESMTLPEVASLILAPFFGGDELSTQLTELCQKAFNFPLPVKKIDETTQLLALTQGPTLSFKDFGAQFLAEYLSHLPTKAVQIVLVATSGDTGSAVAHAFYLKPNLDVIILFPRGQITARQAQQMTSLGKNIMPIAIDGTFDDCQRLVKNAFLDTGLQENFCLRSANSINIGRLLPQIVYYAYSSLQFYFTHQKSIGYIVPTGNLGNATAAFWAKKMGLPIREIVLTTNANKTICDYLDSGSYRPRSSISTLANAMDVGAPNNFERLLHLFHNDFTQFSQHVRAFSADDSAICATIKKIYRHHGLAICPHTATAFFAREKLSNEPWMVVATADPSKFNEIIEPLIEDRLPVPERLQTISRFPKETFTMKAELSDLKNLLTEKYLS